MVDFEWGRSLFHLFHRNSLCKKTEPNGDRVARGLGQSVHTHHTLTLAWLEFLELTGELKGQGVFAAEFPCIAGRGGPTSGQQQLGAHEVPNLGD